MYPWITWEPAADPGTHFGNHWRRKGQQEMARGDQHLGDAFQQLSLRMLTTKRVGVPRYVTEMPVQVPERRTQNWTQPCRLTWDWVPYCKNDTIKQENVVCSLFIFGRINYVCMYVCMYVYIYIYICMYYVCVYVGVYVGIYVGMYYIGM